MDVMEAVDQVREKTGVSYTEAKAALEVNNWNILDSIIYIESEKKTGAENNSAETDNSAQSSTSSSSTDEKAYAVVEATASKKEKAGRTTEGLAGFFRKLISLVTKNELVCDRKGKRILHMPLFILAILLLGNYKVVLVLFVIGLFCGVGYKIEGDDFDESGTVNTVLKKASDEFDTNED